MERLLAEANRFHTMGDYTRAQSLYEQVVLRQPDNLAAHINLGHIHNFDGKLDEAIAEYQIAYRLSPQRTGLRCWLGEICVHKGDPQNAYRWLNEEIAAIRMNPNVPNPYYTAAVCYAALGDKSAAIGCYERYVQLDPSSEWTAKARKEMQSLRGKN